MFSEMTDQFGDYVIVIASVTGCDVTSRIFDTYCDVLSFLDDESNFSRGDQVMVMSLISNNRMYICRKVEGLSSYPLDES